MSKSRTNERDPLKAAAEKHLQTALRLTDEGLAKHSDDPVLPELRGQLTELIEALKTEWPLDEDDPRVAELAWNSLHNIDDYFPKIGEAVSEVCAALGAVHRDGSED